MAIIVSFYGLTMRDIIKQTGSSVDFLNTAAKISLHTSTYAPNVDTDAFFNVATNELSAGTGYNAGGEALGGKTITYDTASDQTRWDANDVSWSFSASKTWRYGVIYQDTAGASSTDPLLALLNWGTDQTVSTTYTLQWDAAGILFVDTT